MVIGIRTCSVRLVTPMEKCRLILRLLLISRGNAIEVDFLGPSLFRFFLKRNVMCALAVRVYVNNACLLCMRGDTELHIHE